MKRSIRFNMWTVFVLLLLLVFILAGAGLYAVQLYKNQVRDISWRANIMPVAGKLSAHVGELRTVLGELRGFRRTIRFRLSSLDGAEDRIAMEGKFQKSLFDVKQAFNEYRQLLEERVAEVGHDDSFEQELSTLHDIRRCTAEVDASVSVKDWGSTDKTLEELETQLNRLQQLAGTLPTYLHEELKGFSQTMKRQARWLNVIVLLGLTVSAILLAMLVRLSYVWIFKPLGILIDGSRKVAAGTFQYRIELSSHDEMAELADAMNRMTERFEEIRTDLDLKVQQRSRELIRSERLASVGFLAAGVAHEINNPLAAISTCAESLQRRVVPLLERDCLERDGSPTNETETIRRYLKMIEDEAFRCKGITEKLLSFARSEKKDRERTDLASLIGDIVDMTRQHDAFKRKEIRLDLPEKLDITANPQEMKQVVLNLLTNALNCTKTNGNVTIRLRRDKENAVLSIADDGVGMDEPTLKNIFEPFFTRREHGQGTGLGLSITHRIIEDHQGRIEARSDGPGHGSMFVVELPLEPGRPSIDR